jgi:hypothetical protein
MNLVRLSTSFLLLTGCLSQAVQLDRVILASDSNPAYLAFWPIVARAWQEVVGIRPTLALIAGPEVQVDESLGDVVRFEPLSNVPTWFSAQNVRTLLPALFPDQVCILSDIDMLPLSRDYFCQPAGLAPVDNLIIYHDQACDDRYPICYLAGSGKVFQQITGVSTIGQIRMQIQNWYQIYAPYLGWDTDEKLFFQLVRVWSGCPGRIFKVGLGRDFSRRINRNLSYDAQKLAAGFYVDAHLPKNFGVYQKRIELILQTVLAANNKCA